MITQIKDGLWTAAISTSESFDKQCDTRPNADGYDANERTDVVPAGRLADSDHRAGPGNAGLLNVNQRMLHDLVSP